MFGWKRSEPRRSISGRFQIRPLLFLIVAGLLVAGCAKSRPPATESSILRISQRNEPADLDPATATLPDEFFIIRALSAGLVTPAPDGGDPQPAAADHWEVSADGLTYTFHLRSGATWSDGGPVIAQDFLTSFQRVLTPNTAAPKAGLFFLVRNAEAFYRGAITDFSQVGFTVLDDHTLQITLAHPAPQFLAYVASDPWIPVNSRAIETYGRAWTRPGHFVGNGPFVLADWKPNQHVIVKRRADYWDNARIHLDEIHFLAFDNGDAEERAFRAGQIDITMSVPISKIADYAAEKPSPLRQIPLHETRFLAFNTRRPSLNDIRVRRAMTIAINRRAIVEHVLHGGQQAAFNFVPEGLGHFRPDKTLREDAAEARRLLAEAGYPGGVGFPVLEMTGWSQTPVLEAIQAMWKQELGITVRIGIRDAKVHVAELQTGSYDIGFMTAIPDVADAADILNDLSSNSPNNYAHWQSPAFDARLDQADHAIDATSRLALLTQAEDILLEACPIAPLYFNAKNILQRSTVRHWQEDAIWTRYYKDVSLTAP